MADTGRLLIADDEDTVLRTTTILLKEEGFACDTARDADEVLALLDKCEYDVLITDWKMPGNTELQLLKAMRTAKHDVPVIVITGYPQLSQALQSGGYSVFEELVKPFEFEDLLSAVHKAVSQSQERRSIRA